MARSRSPARLILFALLATALAACGGSSVAGEPDDRDTPSDCGYAATFADALAPQREIHVDPGGDDSTGRGTAAEPYATLGRALQGVQPGDAVRLHPGTYAGGLYVSDVSGREDAPVWIGGVAGHAKPRIEGGSEAMHLTRVRYLVLHDIEVTASTANGINCDDGGAYANPLATHHVVFDRLDVHDVGAGGNNDGLKLSGVNDYVVRACAFRRVSAGSGIDHVGCHRGRIQGCTFETMGSNAIQLKGGTEDVEVRGCTFESAGQRGINIGGSTGFTFFRPPLSTTAPNAEARNVRVVANVFGSAVTPFAFVGAVDCLVANNTFRAPDYRWLFRVLQETTTSGEYEFLETQSCRLVNNVFHFNALTLSTHVNVGANTRGDTYTISHNLWYAADDDTRSQPTNLPATETNGVYGEDPYPDPSTPPRITAASPAAGRGTPLDQVKGDFEGACYADPPAIGAYAAP
jgi:hypothetical protein